MTVQTAFVKACSGVSGSTNQEIKRQEAAPSLQSDCVAPLLQDGLRSRRHLLPMLGEWLQVPLALEPGSTFVIAKDGRDFEANDTVSVEAKLERSRDRRFRR